MTKILRVENQFIERETLPALVVMGDTPVVRVSGESVLGVVVSGGRRRNINCTASKLPRFTTGASYIVSTMCDGGVHVNRQLFINDKPQPEEDESYGWSRLPTLNRASRIDFPHSFNGRRIHNKGGAIMATAVSLGDPSGIFRPISGGKQGWQLMEPDLGTIPQGVADSIIASLFRLPSRAIQS